MDMIKFAVIGGDMRQVRLADMLREDGYSVVTYAMENGIGERPLPCAENIGEAVSGCDCIVMPLPVVNESGVINAQFSDARPTLNELLGSIEKGMLVVGGKFDKPTLAALRSYGAVCVDYLEREDFACRNAVPTAEGAIQLAMEELPITIQGCRCHILGYGRIGKLLAAKLNALCADVSISARKQSDLSIIEALGMKAVKAGELESMLGSCDLVINTVPDKVLTEPQLMSLRRDCLCIDLASKPGGIDFETAANLGLKVIWALSLPGKVAPLTSGKNVKDVILNIIDEQKL